MAAAFAGARHSRHKRRGQHVSLAPRRLLLPLLLAATTAAVSVAASPAPVLREPAAAAAAAEVVLAVGGEGGRSSGLPGEEAAAAAAGTAGTAGEEAARNVGDTTMMAPGITVQTTPFAATPAWAAKDAKATGTAGRPAARARQQHQQHQGSHYNLHGQTALLAKRSESSDVSSSGSSNGNIFDPYSTPPDEAGATTSTPAGNRDWWQTFTDLNYWDCLEKWFDELHMIFKYGSRTRDADPDAGEDDRPVTWQQHEAQCRSAAGRDYGALVPAGAPVARKPASAAELQRARAALGVRPRGAGSGSSFRERHPAHAARVRSQLDAWLQRRQQRRRQQQHEQAGGAAGGAAGGTGGVAVEDGGGAGGDATGMNDGVDIPGTSAFAGVRRVGLGSVVRRLGLGGAAMGSGGREGRKGAREGREGGGGWWSSWTEAPLGFFGAGGGGAAGGGLRFAPLRHP